MLKTLEGYLPKCTYTSTNDVPFDEENAEQKDKATKKNSSNEEKKSNDVGEEKQNTKTLRKKSLSQEKQKKRSVKKESGEVTPREENRCCSLALDIVGTTCLYVMSIFFICGSAFIHPSSYLDPNRPKEPLVFWTLGVLAYLTTASIDIFKRKEEGALEITMASIALGGGVFWLIGTIFLYNKTNNLNVWCILWLLGSLLNLASITYEIVMLFMTSASLKPLFRTISLALSWVANILLLAGVAHLLNESKSLSICELSNAAGVLISAAIIYLIHSIFHTLAIFKAKVLFSIVVTITE